MKPMLASDYAEDKLRFPLLAQPKIDGVRALNMTGKLTGRSLKPFKNIHVTGRLSQAPLMGLDGEIAAEHHCNPDLCRLTSSALGTIKGTPFVLWWLFDYVTPDTANLPYIDRFQLLVNRLRDLAVTSPTLSHHLRQIPCHKVETLDELLALESGWLEQGYEGLIIRDPNAPHKQGRSTAIEGGLLRIKRFVDFEFTVDEVIEGEENQNEAQINELGHTFRTSHQENKVANGMVGAMTARVLNVVKDGNKVLFEPGQVVRVGAGCLTHDQRKHYFANQAEFKALVHKAKFFPKGIKDKPRFPTWQSFRNASDMGGE